MSISPNMRTVRDLNSACATGEACSSGVGPGGDLDSSSSRRRKGSSFRNEGRREFILAIAILASMGFTGSCRRPSACRAKACAKRGQCGTDIATEHEIRNLVMRRGLAIDDRKLGTRPLCQKGKSGRRIDHKRRTKHEKQIAGPGGGFRTSHLDFRHRLAE